MKREFSARAGVRVVAQEGRPDCTVTRTTCFLRRRRCTGRFGMMEWPVVAALVVGHALVNSQHNKVLQSLGEALEEA